LLIQISVHTKISTHSKNKRNCNHCTWLWSYKKVGGVLWSELSFAMTVKSRTVGQVTDALPRRSSRTITNVTPAGPMFFWAPAKITPNCVQEKWNMYHTNYIFSSFYRK